MGDNNIGGDGGGGDGVNGDDSGGTSPSRQGAKTETSVPRNWSSMAAVLRNFSGKNADPPRVSALEGFIWAERRCQRATRPTPPPGATKEGGATLGCG
jgi:hypothetical protein